MTAQLDDLELDVRFARTSLPDTTQPADHVDDSADCTGDGCTGTEDSAGVTC